MFSVEPWEVESDDVTFENVQSLGQRWELAVHQTRYNQILYFRRINGPLLTASYPLNMPSKVRHKNITSKVVKLKFEECQKDGNWSRLLFWNENFQLRQKGEATRYEMLLWRGGKGFWRDAHCTRLLHNQIFFRWAPANEEAFLIKAPAVEVVARLNKTPDWIFARRVVGLPNDELWREVWAWKNGDHHKLKSVLRWAMSLQEEWWHTRNEMHLKMDLCGEDPVEDCQLWEGMAALQNPNFYSPIPLPLKEAFETAFSWFAPQIKTAYVEQHLCLESLINQDIWLVEIQLESPTAHERIEAAIKWREWLALTQL